MRIRKSRTRNAVVIGISPDGEKSHRKFKTKHNLPFILLSDEDHRVAEMYGAWGEKSMYGRKYMASSAVTLSLTNKAR